MKISEQGAKIEPGNIGADDSILNCLKSSGGIMKHRGLIMVFAIEPFLTAKQYCNRNYDETKKQCRFDIEQVNYRTYEEDGEDRTSEEDVSKEDKCPLPLPPDLLPSLFVVSVQPSLAPLPYDQGCEITSNPKQSLRRNGSSPLHQETQAEAEDHAGCKIDIRSRFIHLSFQADRGR